MLLKGKEFKKFFLKKENLFILFSFLFYFLFFPFSSEAAVWDFLANVVLFVPTLIIAVGIGVMILLTGGIAWLFGAILDWIISPNFISYSFTNPDKNPVIKIGLNLTQSFVNIIIVGAFIYIAFVIALRLAGEKEAKKAFVTLLLVALFVNFAPLFCGIVVDATNIIMNFFLSGLREGVSAFPKMALDFGFNLTKKFFSFSGNWETKLGLLTMGAIQIILNAMTAVAFIIYGGIFFLRYLAIWILVILAPLAFAFYALPLTRKFFDFWLKNFIEWAIIGIPLAFFLYLAMFTFIALSKITIGIPMSGFEPETKGFMDKAMPFFTVLGFLFLGFALGLKSSALGTETILKFGTALQKATRTAVTQATLRRIRAGGKALGGKALIQEGRILRRPIGSLRTLRKEGLKKGAVTLATGRYSREKGIFVRPEKAPPTEAPPTERPPTEAPPTERPPTEAPPTEGPPTEAPAPKAPPTKPPKKIPPSLKKLVSFGKALDKAVFGAKKGVVGTITDIAEKSLRGAGLRITTAGYKKCPICGFDELHEEAKFCTKCGYSFEKKS